MADLLSSLPLDVHATEAQPSARQAVRRGAVRQGRKQITASSWEHVQMVLSAQEEAQISSSLHLLPTGKFHALAGVSKICGGAVAMGTWRSCRHGVELVFAECPELGLQEVRVDYRLRGDCLVADDCELPDGLEQEYNPCEISLPPPSVTTCAAIGDISTTLEDLDRAAGHETPFSGHGVGVEVDDVSSDTGRAFPIGLILEDDDGSDDDDWPPTSLGNSTYDTTTSTSVGDETRGLLDTYPDDFESDEASEGLDESGL